MTTCEKCIFCGAVLTAERIAYLDGREYEGYVLNEGGHCGECRESAKHGDPLPSHHGPVKLSLTCLDVGFDPRVSADRIVLALPLRGVHTVAYHPRGQKSAVRDAVGTLVSVAEELARAGYSLVVCQTANGRNVECRPSTSGMRTADVLSDIVWSVQAKNDNVWMNGMTLESALEHAGWTEHDLRPN